MAEALTNYMEEFADDYAPQDQESNIGLVIDGEVCKHFSADSRCFCVINIYVQCCLTLLFFTMLLT